MACWNHPFEVARIEAQTLGNAGKPVGSMVTVMCNIVKADGVGGLFEASSPAYRAGRVADPLHGHRREVVQG